MEKEDIEKVLELNARLQSYKDNSLNNIIAISHDIGLVLGLTAKVVRKHGVRNCLVGEANGAMGASDLQKFYGLLSDREAELAYFLTADTKQGLLKSLIGTKMSGEEILSFMEGLDRSFNGMSTSEFQGTLYEGANQASRFSTYCEDYTNRYIQYRKLLIKGWGEKAPELRRADFTTLSDFKPASATV